MNTTTTTEWMTVSDIAKIAQKGDIVQIEAEVFGAFPAREPLDAGPLGLVSADGQRVDWPLPQMKARIVRP